MMSKRKRWTIERPDKLSWDPILPDSAPSKAGRQIWNQTNNDVYFMPQLYHHPDFQCLADMNTRLTKWWAQPCWLASSALRWPGREQGWSESSPAKQLLAVGFLSELNVRRLSVEFSRWRESYGDSVGECLPLDFIGRLCPPRNREPRVT